MMYKGSFKSTIIQSNSAKSHLMKLFSELTRTMVCQMEGAMPHQRITKVFIYRHYKIDFYDYNDEIIEIIHEGRKGFVRNVNVSGSFTIEEENQKEKTEDLLATAGFHGFFSSRVYKTPPKDVRKVKLYLKEDRMNTSKKGEIYYKVSI